MQIQCSRLNTATLGGEGMLPAATNIPWGAECVLLGALSVDLFVSAWKKQVHDVLSDLLE